MSAVSNAPDPVTRPDPATRIVEATWALILDDPSRDPSVRAIASAASVNLAMVSYYFQGKDGLFGVMFHAYAKPLHGERVRRLSMLAGEHLTLENVIAAWFAGEFDDESADRFSALCRVLSLHHAGLYRRLYSEAFDEGSRQFVDVLCGLLPRLSRDVIAGRLYATATAVAAAYDPFVLESMNAMYGGDKPIDRARWLADLITYATAGLRAGAEDA